MFVTTYKTPTGHMERTIKCGDVVCVNNFVYGPKLPSSPDDIPWFNLLYRAAHRNLKAYDVPQWPHTRLTGVGAMQRGVVIVFEHPGNSDIY